MKLKIELDTGEPFVNNFTLAGAIYDLCKGLYECDAETVARMILQEVDCERYRGYAKYPCPPEEE